MANFYPNLNPQKALIWRIIHRDNLLWTLDNGLHCGNSIVKAPNWVSIGNPDLTAKRARHPVPLPPGGFLNDYVPFYFTPFSAMMRNINTGWGGIKQRRNDEILILVSSMHHLAATGVQWLFTDMHAYYGWANFYDNLGSLNKIDWPILQRRDFARDPEDPRKFERYQAEALVFQNCPIEGLLGVVCYTDALRTTIEKEIGSRNLNLEVHARTEWYF